MQGIGMTVLDTQQVQMLKSKIGTPTPKVTTEETQQVIDKPKKKTRTLPKEKVETFVEEKQATPRERLGELKRQVQHILADFDTPKNAKALMSTIQPLLDKVQVVAQELDAIGMGSSSEIMLDVSKKVKTLQQKVLSKALTSAKEFKAAYKVQLERVAKFDMAEDGVAQFSEGIDTVQSLEYKSVSALAEGKKKAKVFWMTASIMITGAIPKPAVVKMQDYWKMKSVMRAAYVIEDAKFLVINTNAIKEDLEEYAQAVCAAAKPLTPYPVAPYFGITHKTDRFFSVLLLPESTARYGMQIFEAASRVQLYIKA